MFAFTRLSVCLKTQSRSFTLARVFNGQLKPLVDKSVETFGELCTAPL